MRVPFEQAFNRNDLFSRPTQRLQSTLDWAEKDSEQMTALNQYEKLESTGLWRADADAQRREVTVSFGDATLIILDSAGRPLTHWSLPAVTRMNIGERPALFSPDEIGSETLEIGDDLMIDAIETVRKTVARRRPKPGRLRGLGISITVAAVAAAAVFWLPSALRQHTMTAVTPATRASIGATLLGHVQRLSGSVCNNPRGAQALRHLAQRALGTDSRTRVLIVPDAVPTTLAIPGDIILLNRSLVEDYEDPAVPAGFLIAADIARTEVDPMKALLEKTGIRATFNLLTTGDMTSETLQRYAETIVGRPASSVDTETLLSRFEDVEISARPFAYALDVTGESTLDLIEADPIQPAEAPLILSDGDWIALQGICGN